MLNNVPISTIGYSNKESLFAVLIFLSLILLAPVQAVRATDASQPIITSKTRVVNDLRVIVDISGSMKKTDPKNLRRPAVRLLAGLIPNGARSGIWNFGKEVNMSVKIGSVNDKWRTLAREQSKKINSVGLYTNIESAMRKASFDWNKPDPRYKRDLILLTDGHVDVSPDDEEDKASRKRILKEILPALEKAKVRIHTIALSDDVDESLLSTLSAYTNGLYKKVNNADDLQKLFLQMLEQSVKLDTLPLTENQFNVDASVNDMTLLVFNKDTSEPTKLITPDNKTWSEKSANTKVKWFRDEGFDLITIKKPQQGQWTIVAPVDKNNRVVVATNLKLNVNELPGYLMFGDILTVTAQLHQDGKPLTDNKLLSKFDFSISRKIEGHGEWLYEMSRPEENKNISEYHLPAILKEGINELVIKATSPTVQREVRHQFKVYETPAEIKISKNNGSYEIKVKPYANLLRPDSVKINAVLNDKSTHDFVRDNKEWRLNIDNKYQQTEFTLNINAIRADGKAITMSFNKILASKSGVQGLTLLDEKNINKVALNDKSIVKAAIDVKKDKVAPDEAENEKEQLPDRTETRKKEADMSWPMIIGLVAIGNIFLIIVLGGSYFFLKKRKAKMTKDMQDQIGDIDSGESSTDESNLEELKP